MLQKLLGGLGQKRLQMSEQGFVERRRGRS